MIYNFTYDIKMDEVRRILRMRGNIQHIGFYVSTDMRTNGRPVFQGTRGAWFYVSATGRDTYIKEESRHKVNLI